MADARINALTEDTALVDTDWLVAEVGDSEARKVSVATLRGAMNEAYGLFGKPPDFAGSGDCDFDGSLGPYTAVGVSSGTVSLLSTSSSDDLYDLASLPGCLLVQAGSNQTAEFRADVTVADGDGVTLGTSVFGPVGTDNAAIALRLNDNDTSSTSGVHVTMMIEQDTTAWEPQGNSSANASGVEHNTVSMFHNQAILLRIVRASLTYHCLYSLDGWTWSHIFSQAVGGALTNIWISVAAPSTATWTANPVTAIPWIKVGAATYMPW